MKKIIFILITIISIILTSCNAPTEIKTLSADGVESAITYNFNDFFNPVELVYKGSDKTSITIIMDENTGVLYVMKWSGYQWGISPIYDSDGSVLTKEKWLARHNERKD